MSALLGVFLFILWIAFVTRLCLSTAPLLFVESAKRLVGRCGRS